MTLIMRTSDENTISLPGWLMKKLNLAEGDAMTPVVEGRSLHLKPLHHFLALRGVFQDDDDFENAITELEASWQQWTVFESA